MKTEITKHGISESGNISFGVKDLSNGSVLIQNIPIEHAAQVIQILQEYLSARKG